MGMRYSAICFDLFHTLVDVATVPANVGAATADVLEVDQGQWNDACFSSVHEICEVTEHQDVVQQLAHSIDKNISLRKIEKATQSRQARFDYALAQVENEIIEQIQSLRNSGVKTVLVSNASSGEVSAWKDSPLASCFDEVIFSCECGMAKPDPGIYQLALNKLGVTANQALFVGDGGSQEHEGARAVGLSPVLMKKFTWDNLSKEELRLRAMFADYEIYHIGDLQPIVHVE
ncbi:hypothetical protein MNBD_GAMMA12-3858 [hydrothermal vent metagenome]|uniref:Uncharacterized protein n=1 Tax=hydrothermal vent metagenome TaxID=652676 RepID=A0A3B0YR64_9ZZZZ